MIDNKNIKIWYNISMNSGVSKMDTKKTKNTSSKIPSLSVSKYMIAQENAKENTQKKIPNFLRIIVPKVITALYTWLKK